MIRLTYISTAKRDLPIGTIPSILAASRRNNRRDGLTGLLLSDGVRFLQALEGEAPAIAATFARIQADPRHRACVLLDRRTIDARAFAAWDMAWRGVDPVEQAATLAETVDAIAAGIDDRSLRALFTSFAQIDRSAA